MEWGTVLAILTIVTGLVVGWLGWHEKRIMGQAKQHNELSAEVSKIAGIQAECQRSMIKRLEAGDRHFDRFDRQLDAFTTSVGRLNSTISNMEATSKHLVDQLKIMDERVFHMQAMGPQNSGPKNKG